MVGAEDLRVRLRATAVVVSVAAAWLIAPAGPVRASETYAVPVTIDPTGKVDVTKPLNNFIAGVPDGSTISFQQGARYRVEGTIRAKDRSGLTFAGNGATVFATTRGGADRAQFVFVRGSTIALHDINVIGANTTGDWHKL